MWHGCGGTLPQDIRMIVGVLLTGEE